jgi:thiol-disulfide isomerase/thioredoxin
VVLIDFWATWCQPCKKEMPGYQRLVDRYRSRGFTVVGFKFDTMMDMEDPALFAKKIGARYPLAVAADDLKQKFGDIEGLPATLLYDRQEILRKKVVGFKYTDTIESGAKATFLNGASPVQLLATQTRSTGTNLAATEMPVFARVIGHTEIMALILEPSRDAFRALFNVCQSSRLPMAATLILNWQLAL